MALARSVCRGGEGTAENGGKREIKRHGYKAVHKQDGGLLRLLTHTQVVIFHCYATSIATKEMESSTSKLG